MVSSYDVANEESLYRRGERLSIQNTMMLESTLTNPVINKYSILIEVIA